ncbi:MULTISPECIES: helix-turn-helix domain-containing protein [Streptomyces]|uniref:Helix-turn-helix domain-containing protein n=1 Tax=Streptomyces caniscabiei TaxID=2746961 RepID=A0ABU4MX32_9ACTN|nr:MULTISPECIES: helix-turn-helix domain-containing protein [Streptomyces]MBE4734565.1 helix-turn-helix transcriptional regulator [Streptomyces caniscabiei]MBE4755436.1 helix-turn-helix transcriptional regulator [Streptomyces caniscabiei]MBE4772440.1 helix-turn-helix transcriptional regulator [Streptomyces caniscabiei]MBE4783280.1 helix-turn-helix transcriptional regulator [Streptomyces caniscabiei]MBE4792584.1 helix-turn-helix transcriptional regulator [Streptomyces caniscabiei]
MLGAIGLDETHESAYRALVSVGAADVPDLARRLALGEHDTERALRRLERHGLAAQSSARPGRWVAAPPGVALGALLTQQRHELEKAELTAALLAEEYRTNAAEPAAHDLVEVVIGSAAIAQRFLQLQLGATEEVCAMVTGAPIAVSGPENNPAEEQATGRGVGYRVVVERAVLDEDAGLTELSAALGREERVRVMDEVPTKLVIADRTLAMLPLTTHTAEPAALVVHASGLLELLSGLFESVWRQALPLRLGSGRVIEDVPDAPDATDLEILSLLLAGMTDASVAKQLDLGLRTVQRRVKGLMELAGVTTRLQLGWHAYERAWVTRD